MKQTTGKPTIFINTTGCNDWILSIIAKDIEKYLTADGYECHTGMYDEYNEEDIAYHMWWRTAMPYKKAKHNSIFITHTDDALKEYDLMKIKDSFDSFITMSDEDESFLKGLGFDTSRVFGVNLPVRNNYVRPLSISIFSNCYSDYRKNENWLLDFCSNSPYSHYLNYVFIGNGWGKVVEKLAEYSCSFEWHCASRKLPYEYMFQQIKLSNADYYIYMGMDGGAMGTYDAYAMGLPLCVSEDGYHKGLPNVERFFKDKQQFLDHMTDIAKKQKQKYDFFEDNSVHNYVCRLISIWNGNYLSNNLGDNNSVVVEKRRDNYFNISFNRIIQWVSGYKWKCVLKYKYCKRNRES